MLEAALYGVPVVTMSEASRGPLNFDDYRPHPGSDHHTRGLAGSVVDGGVRTSTSARRWDRNERGGRLGSREDGVARASRRCLHLALGTIISPRWSRVHPLRSYDDAIHELHRAGGLTRNFDEWRPRGLRFGTEPQAVGSAPGPPARNPPRSGGLTTVGHVDGSRTDSVGLIRSGVRGGGIPLVEPEPGVGTRNRDVHTTAVLTRSDPA